MKKLVGVLAVVSALSACDGSAPANDIYDDADQPFSDCGGDPPMSGTVGNNTGAACERAATDCLEECCHCDGDQNGSFWMSECYHGSCAAPKDACRDACAVRPQQ